ncbi:MAG: DUF5131 family protein [Richelia sp. SL_2_1]|nr:DUF5131 family protein [Richelia sp. SL_2_1]
MAQNSKIQWTDATWNPWHGCKKVSAGCKFCYMYRDKERYGHDPSNVLRSKSTFYDPMNWSFQMQNVKLGEKLKPSFAAFPNMRIFTCSWSDFLYRKLTFGAGRLGKL